MPHAILEWIQEQKKEMVEKKTLENQIMSILQLMFNF